MEILKESGQEKKSKYEEPPYAKKKLEKGEFAIGYFHGQTFLFIPKTISEVLGAQRIRDLADQIFSKEVLDKFAGLVSNDYEQSYFMELPPQSDWDDNQITKFIQAIKDEIKNE
ncbi:MAG: hypothetical protein CO140_02400 [Candidatus Moranbacteria bacterium CG_4_9_14_3_um_filter_40_7]|nr:MAG: hypothetical protein COX31_01460 [Candidatus Moranbacteria bacterium CG23_combo_of_CG06-09_8_20_14_all_40_16]PJA87786.1 MAG: hypothetical protein CO140_02400 [Candidatus Moranbacteria bacterium CG_4_9_14_3_um_filter_40_7]